ncbi:transferase family-domain-containing protein [Mycena capillaripes]|nr:transferase family-domain-containing protein [Mycena capillaripes]
MTSTVSVTSRHTVHCANEASWIALESLFRLGAFDQVAGFVPLQVVWVYEQPPSAQQLIPVERLQRAMTLLLDYYPQLTGRIQVDPSSGIREIARLGTGAELLVAQCSERLDASGTSSPESRLLDLPGAGNALLPPFDPTPEGTCRAPIFAIQHTRFACGGVALGVRSHHSVSDADGFFQLVRDLAELYRGVLSSETNDDPTSGVASLAHPPHVRPYMSELVGGNIPPEERQAALDFQPSRLHVAPPASAVVESDAKPVSSPIFSHPVVGRFLRFSSSALAALKVEATEPNGSEWVTTFDALSAHLYQRVHRARLQLLAKDPTFGPLSRTDFLIPVNLRSRLDLPARYFPNTLFTSYTTIPPPCSLGRFGKLQKSCTACRAPGGWPRKTKLTAHSSGSSRSPTRGKSTRTSSMGTAALWLASGTSSTCIQARCLTLRRLWFRRRSRRVRRLMGWFTSCRLRR